MIPVPLRMLNRLATIRAEHARADNYGASHYQDKTADQCDGAGRAKGQHDHQQAQRQQ
jgi:hypothetical protein